METDTQAVVPAAADNLPDPVTPAPSAEPAANGADSAPPPEPKATPEKVLMDPKEIQARFDKLTRERYEERRARELLEREVAQLRAPPAKTEPVAPAKVPTLEDFDFDSSKYQAAMVEYAAAEARKVALETLKSEREQQAVQARIGEFRAREAKFAEKTADYHETVYDETVPISDAMAEVIRESDVGPELAYYLGKNRDKAAEIARLSPISAARELGRIEARLNQPPPPPPVVSAAPPPPPKLAASEPAIEKDPAQMTDKEFKKWREKSIAAYRARST